jgi:hypothetical protein
MAKAPNPSKPREIVVVGSKIKEVVKEAGLRDDDHDGFSLTKVTLDGVESKGKVFDPSLTIDTHSPVPFSVQAVISPAASKDGTDGPAAALDVVVASDDDDTTSPPTDDFLT